MLGPLCKVGLLYPISKDYMVWTGSAPIRLVKEAGVDFDPTNGGRFRASTQAIEGVDNALEVGAAFQLHLSGLLECCICPGIVGTVTC